MKVIKKKRTINKIVWRYLRERCLGKTEELDKYIKTVDELNEKPSKELIDKVKQDISIIEEYRGKDIVAENLLNELYVVSNIFIQKAIRELTPPEKRQTKWEDFEDIAKEYNAFEIEEFKYVFDKINKNLKTKTNKKFEITEEEYEELKTEVEILEDKLYDIDLYLYYKSKQEFDGALRVFKNRIEKNTKTEVGAKIKEIREDKGFSLIDISISTGFSVSYIYRIEQGQRNLSISVALKIAEALGVPLNTFYYSEELDMINNQKVAKLEDIIKLQDYTIDSKKAKRTEKKILSNMATDLIKLRNKYKKKNVTDIESLDKEDLKNLGELLVQFLNK